MYIVYISAHRLGMYIYIDELKLWNIYEVVKDRQPKS
jgi:hypothetical protein